VLARGHAGGGMTCRHEIGQVFRPFSSCDHLVTDRRCPNSTSQADPALLARQPWLAAEFEAAPWLLPPPQPCSPLHWRSQL